ncbi:MAG: hypothetical protein IKE91_04390 [Clostridia bacterium]|nr:hypothetical protein [Clostridia bacterium]
MQDLIYFLKRKYKNYLRIVGQAEKGAVLGVMAASLTITMGMTIMSVSRGKAESPKMSEVNYTRSPKVVLAEIAEPAITREETTTETELTSTTTLATSTTDGFVTESLMSTMLTTTTEETTLALTEVYTTVESVVETEVSYICSGVGQYGMAINPDEYMYLAEVIEHEGGYCPLYVQEHIGICLLNRVFVPGFADSIYGCKEQSGQYFSGYYPFSDESAELAKTLIAAYNSGGEYWSQYCEERGMNCRTKFQRNDYCVPGTTYVTDDYDCTSGGFWFHMYYSE